jgi:hypothetical protein
MKYDKSTLLFKLRIKKNQYKIFTNRKFDGIFEFLHVPEKNCHSGFVTHSKTHFLSEDNKSLTLNLLPVLVEYAFSDFRRQRGVTDGIRSYMKKKLENRILLKTLFMCNVKALQP